MIEIHIDGGDSVICDECNTDFTNSKDSGGFVFYAHAVCPKCAASTLESIHEYKEEQYIEGYCKEGQSFADFIREYRKTQKSEFKLGEPR